jgi:hypothetical protein
MTAAAPPSTAPAPAAPRTKKPPPNELTIISHSNLFYWWPVWLCGFIMAGITFFQGFVMAIVPEKGADAAVNAQVTVTTPTRGATPHDPQVVVWAPQSEDPNHVGAPVEANEAKPPYLRVSPHKALGVTFVIVLLLVLTITNVPMRGMWSVLVIVVAVALTVIFIVTGFWETLLTWFFFLDVRINMAGYLTISIFLLIIWALAVFFFDKQRYITFTPGQFKVCDEIGGGENVYTTDGLTLQKQRSDFFRHYIIGLGSGDLIVRTTGAQSHHYDLPNVLFINAKVRQIEELISRKVVIDTK